MRARGINGNEEILTRRPVPSDPQLREQENGQIRSKAKCNGVTDCQTSITGESCDEYPPASTEEGYQGLYGIDVFSKCIDKVQNSRGGRRLQNTLGLGKNAIPAGSTFVSRVKNLDCNTIAPADPGPIQSFPPKSKRQSSVTKTTTIYPPLPGDPSGFALLAFGDLDPGTGGIIAPNTPATLQFSLDLRDYGVSMVAFTFAEAIEIQWTLTLNTPDNGTSTSLPNGTSSSSLFSAPTSGHHTSCAICNSSTSPGTQVTSSITTTLTVSTSCSTSTADVITSLSTPTRQTLSTICTTSPSLGSSNAVITRPTSTAHPSAAGSSPTTGLDTAIPSASRLVSPSMTHAEASPDVVVIPSTTTSVNLPSSTVSPIGHTNSTTPVGLANLSPSQFTGAAAKYMACSWFSLYGFLFAIFLLVSLS